jgi:hypothetical protein
MWSSLISTLARIRDAETDVTDPKKFHLL